MRTKDFREFLADNLQDAESRREFIVAFYELDGIDGIHAALEEIADADAVNKVSPASAVPNGKDDLNSLRATLNAMGLDLGLVRLPVSGDAKGQRDALVAV